MRECSHCFPSRWLERRFEVHVDEDATSLEVYLQAWQTDSSVTVEFDAIRLWKGRQDPPIADPGDEPWSGAPFIDVAPQFGGGEQNKSTYEKKKSNCCSNKFLFYILKYTN